MAALRSKYLPRRRLLLPSVSRGQCVDNLAGLWESMLSLESGVAPDTGGMRIEFLTTQAEVWSNEEMARMEEFGLGMEYLNGLLPPWFYRVWGTVITIPLFKTEQRLNRLQQSQAGGGEGITGMTAPQKCCLTQPSIPGGLLKKRFPCWWKRLKIEEF